MDEPNTALRVLFIHGKESNPHGTKGRALATCFEVHGEQMNTDDFAGSVQLQAEAVRSFAPDVVVGSSYGGAVLCALMDAGHWRGPSLLLAPATRLYAPSATLTAGVPVVIVHGHQDDVVPIVHSRELAASGTPECTRLHEVQDDHRLSATVASGQLLDFVRETHALAQRAM